MPTGLSIERLCDIVANDPLEHEDTLGDRNAMVRAARALLNSVTRVLLLADIVVVKQLLLTKDKVCIHSGIVRSGNCIISAFFRVLGTENPWKTRISGQFYGIR